MSIYIVPKNKLKKSANSLLAKTIYQNFNYITNTPELNHNMNEVNRLLTNDDAQIYLYMINKKIAGYLAGEIMKLNDGRKVFFITYLYTAKKFRNRGIASQLMDLSEQYVRKFGLSGVMLICDTHKQKLYDFYLKKGFMPDFLLRNNNRHEVLYKVV